MRLNIFHHFFARLLAVFILVTVVATSGIYWYFEQRAATIFHNLVDEETTWFDKATTGLDWEQKTHQPMFMEAFQELVQRRELVQLLITSTDGDEVFYYNKINKVPKLLPGKDLNAPVKPGAMEYRLIRRNSQYLLLFSVYPRSIRGKVVVWGLLPMEDVFAEQVEGATLIAITVVLITAALIGITILPLVRHAYKKVEQHRKALQRSYLATTQTLGRAIAKRDNQTNRHNFRVAYYALRLGEQIGLDRNTLRSLTLGSFLHDLGKIGIPDNILLKPRRLDEAERKVMQGHVSHGLEIIEDIEWLNLAKAVIGSHHERFNGNGYPSKLKGEKIPIEARVFAVVDVFDALISERPYKPAFSMENALAHLEKGVSTHFDPEIVEIFIAIAPALYKEVANLNERRLQILLQQAAARHFPEQRFPYIAKDR